MPKVNIDAIDRKILLYLVKNARMPFLEIARECGISGAAIHQRVKKLDDAGILKGSRFEVDPKKLGFDVCAFIGMRVSDPSKNHELVKRLMEIPEITECHFVTGDYTILMKLYCLSNEHLMQTIFTNVLNLPWIIHTETFISLNEAFIRPIDVSIIDDEHK